MEKYAAEIEKMEAQLNLWSGQLRVLEARIECASSSIKLQRARELNELRRKQHLATQKLYDMKKTGHKTWDQVKELADKIWRDLKAGIANVQSNAT